MIIIRLYLILDTSGSGLDISRPIILHNVSIISDGFVFAPILSWFYNLPFNGYTPKYGLSSSDKPSAAIDFAESPSVNMRQHSWLFPTIGASISFGNLLHYNVFWILVGFGALDNSINRFLTVLKISVFLRSFGYGDCSLVLLYDSNFGSHNLQTPIILRNLLFIFFGPPNISMIALCNSPSLTQIPLIMILLIGLFAVSLTEHHIFDPFVSVKHVFALVRSVYISGICISQLLRLMLTFGYANFSYPNLFVRYLSTVIPKSNPGSICKNLRFGINSMASLLFCCFLPVMIFCVFFLPTSVVSTNHYQLSDATPTETQHLSDNKYTNLAPTPFWPPT